MLLIVILDYDTKTGDQVTAEASNQGGDTENGNSQDKQGTQT